MSRMRQAFEESWQREVGVMTEVERATVRACLNQAATGLEGARAVKSWWLGLGPSVRSASLDGEVMVAALRRDLDNDVKELGPAAGSGPGSRDAGSDAKRFMTGP